MCTLAETGTRIGTGLGASAGNDTVTWAKASAWIDGIALAEVSCKASAGAIDETKLAWGTSLQNRLKLGHSSFSFLADSLLTAAIQRYPFALFLTGRRGVQIPSCWLPGSTTRVDDSHQFLRLAIVY